MIVSSLLACGILASTAGCGLWTGHARSLYETVPNEPNADTERAKKLNKDGLTKLEADKVAEAEQLFRDALAADVDFGPAHNNLGRIYLKRHQFYLAAWEFQFAANLMPDRAEPLVNLGLVYETVNRLEEARTAYEEALDVSPESTSALSNLARVFEKIGDDPEKTVLLLREVVMRDSRHEWHTWAGNLLAVKYRSFADVPPVWPMNEPPSDGVSPLPSPLHLESEPISTPNAGAHDPVMRLNQIRSGAEAGHGEPLARGSEMRGPPEKQREKKNNAATTLHPVTAKTIDLATGSAR